VVGGIEWNPHFTDLRVSITNPTGRDYEKIDFLIYPDSFFYKAAIIDMPHDCEMTALLGSKRMVASMVVNGKGGPTTFTTIRTGEIVDFRDTAGNVYIAIASDGGYRLRCQTIPSHSTIQIVFALVNANFSVKKPPPGWTSMQANVVTGIESVFDFLGEKPNAKRVIVQGSYQLGKQPFSLKCISTVWHGS
jgi:hypothetical protein